MPSCMELCGGIHRNCDRCRRASARSTANRRPKTIRPFIYNDSPSRPPFPSHNRVVRIQIAEVLTGVDPGQKEIEILTGMGGGDCGYAFQSGMDYIVYA